MKIPINLASQPFRRDRAMVVASVAVSLALVATLGWLISFALADRAQSADVRRDVARLEAQVRRVAAQQAALDATLRRPENAEVLERSVFLNVLLTRKGISWTRILSDLEKTLPYNMRVVQIHPSITGQNQVELDMTVATDSPAPMFEFLKALAASDLFGPAEVTSTQPPTQSEPSYRYHVTVPYAQKL